MNSKMLVFLLVLPAVISCGCASIVNSTKENGAPSAQQNARDLRYYLPKGKVQVSGTWNKDNHGWDLKVTPVIEAEGGTRHRIYRHHNILFDDDVTFAVDPTTGLLLTVNGSSTDQTINGLASLAAAVGSAFTFGAELGPVTGYRGNVVKEGFKEVQTNAFLTFFQATVDPDHPSVISYARSPDSSNQVVFAKISIGLHWLDYDQNKNASSTTNTDFKGIVVRRPIPFSLTLVVEVFNFDGTASARYSNNPQTILLPDTKHDFVLPIDRTPFVANATKVSLNNGMVQSYQEVRPSIVLGMIGIPKTILGALVPIPLQVRQQQQNNLDAVDKSLKDRQDIRTIQAK